MASIYIVNVSVGGYYIGQYSYYHRSEGEAVDSFEECKASVGEGPTIIELVRLDTETLDATTITGWEGTIDDLDEEDGIVEGAPGE